MKTDTYLFFKGNCEEALKYYEKVLGAKIQALMPHRGTPAESFSSPEWLDKILHARIQVGDNVILASDAPPDRYSKPEGFTVCLHADSGEEAERMFKALAENGSVGMPIEETFFATRFGMLRDQFDIPWMVICEKTPN